MNFYKHHLGDYDGHTAHLTWDEDMAYTRLLRAYYRREKGIPDAEKYRLARAATAAHRKAVDSVLTEFFTLQDGMWIQKRCDEEIEAYQAQASTNRRIAQERTYARKANESLTNRSPVTLGKREPNQNQIPEPDTRKGQNQGADAPDWLPAEWDEYVQHRKEKRSALTPTATKQCLAKLKGWYDEGHDLTAIIRHNIANGYTGLFLPNAGKGASNQSAAAEAKRQIFGGEREAN